MGKPEFRTLDELVTLYRLEPQLRDIYVEGTTDRSFVDWFLRVQGLKNIIVKEISGVEVPAEMVLGRGLNDNQRGRVIALAHYLEDKFGPDFQSVTCIADGDFDHINSHTHSTKLLMLTDYTSLEMYFFNARSLNKLLNLALLAFPKSAEKVIEEIRPVLEDLFVVRMANSKLGWGLRDVNPERSCSVGAVGVQFDFDNYVARYLHASNRYADKTEFMHVVIKSKGQLTAEPRIQIHGHDFVRFLAWYIRQHKGYKFARDDIVERALFACAESSELISEKLFQSLLGRLK